MSMDCHAPDLRSCFSPSSTLPLADASFSLKMSAPSLMLSIARNRDQSTRHSGQNARYSLYGSMHESHCPLGMFWLGHLLLATCMRPTSPPPPRALTSQADSRIAIESNI